jgi:hypothetical protein
MTAEEFYQQLETAGLITQQSEAVGYQVNPLEKCVTLPRPIFMGIDLSVSVDDNQPLLDIFRPLISDVAKLSKLGVTIPRDNVRRLLIQDIDGDYRVRVLVGSGYTKATGVDYDYQSLLQRFISEIIFVHQRDLTGREPFALEDEFRGLLAELTAWCCKLLRQGL